MRRFIVAVEGLPLEELEEVELSQLPAKGEPIETKYGTCVVTAAEVLADGSQYEGKITCAFP